MHTRKSQEQQDLLREISMIQYRIYKWEMDCSRKENGKIVLNDLPGLYVKCLRELADRVYVFAFLIALSRLR